MPSSSRSSRSPSTGSAASSSTSARLVEIIQQATPAAVQRAGHPAKRVF
ncbi:16S rRNA (cytosine(1402)-N(4))-methyltransferase, partial [Clavibacter michiganensis subsp. insidiosus]